MKKKLLLVTLALTIAIIAACNNPFLRKNVEKVIGGDDDPPDSEITLITSAAVTEVHAPAKGAAPNSTAHCATANVTVSAVSWSGSPAVFLPSTAYTVSVALKAADGYAFAESLSAAINGHTAAVTNNTGSAAMLTYTFPATLDKDVTNIAVKTQPTKLTYSHGDTPDLAGLEVTLTFEDSTTEDVAFDDFDQFGITTIPEYDEPLSVSEHGGRPIEVWCGELYAPTNNLTVLEKTITSASGIEMVRIAAGTFLMGSPTDEPSRVSNETLHEVKLTAGFYMGKYLVTQEQYETVMETNPSNFKTPVSPETSTARRPVETVRWFEAIVFCNKLSVMDGLTPAYSIDGETDPDEWGDMPTSTDHANYAKWNGVEVVEGSTGYRLPTEAQWEYACRAGTQTPFSWGSAIDDSKANYNASYVGAYNTVAGANLNRTSEVGSYAPNDWGLYDMHGNLFEWCWDRYAEYGGTAGTQEDPVGAAVGTLRVRRGGWWYNYGWILRSALRGYSIPSNRGSDMGFRLLRP